MDKLIDTIATAIRLGGTAPGLAELELAYAPPFSSAKDPVNLAGYQAENVIAGLTTPLLYAELPSELALGAKLVDVRTPQEFASGHLAEAVNLPLDSLRENLAELDRAVPLVVYCKIGLRGYLAERILKQHGFMVKNLQGGYTSARTEDFQPTAEAAPSMGG